MRIKSTAVIKEILIVIAIVAIAWLVLMAIFGTQNPFYVVSSGSMVPHLMVYDVIVVQGNDPFEQVQVGDVIVFDRPSDHNRVIVHRVVAILDDDPYTVRTQGDANPAAIPGTDFPITAKEYIGTVVYVIPQLGFITRIFAHQIGGIPLNYIIIAIIVGFLIARQFINKKESRNDSDIEDAAKLDTDIPKDSEYVNSTDDSQKKSEHKSHSESALDNKLDQDTLDK